MSRYTIEAVRRGTDPACGATITQLTSEPVTSHNIYCEQNYCSPDGKRVALVRTPFGAPGQVWVCDLETFRLTCIGEGEPVNWNAQPDSIYLVTREAGTPPCLKRLDMNDLGLREQMVFEDEAPRKLAVSADERWAVGGPFHLGDNRYSLRLYEIDSGRESVLCELEDMINPHHQFDPGGSNMLMVQINRGGRYDVDTGAVLQLTGPQGSTLCTVAVPSGRVKPLPAGIPDTPRISGHQCWVGKSGKLLFTTYPAAHSNEPERAGIYRAAPAADEAERVASGLPFNHLSASTDSRFFVADDHSTLRIYVGSLATGRYRELCHSHTCAAKPQHAHTHPYLTPDNRHVIFNSIATGVAQVYAARLPDGFLEELEQE